jgi:hypothetical protein
MPRGLKYIGSEKTPRTIGAGVERGVFRTVFEQVTKMHQFWARQGSFMGPIFVRTSEPLPERIYLWKTFGSLIALHMYYFKQGPAGISPLLVLALQGGRAAMNPSAAYIAHMDPETADTMHPWLSLTHTDTIPTSPHHPLSSFLMNYIEIQVFFCSSKMLAYYSLVMTGINDPKHKVSRRA